jgi:hypothetical protein
MITKRAKIKIGLVQRAAFTILATAALITVATIKGAFIVPDQPSMYRFTSSI